MHDIVNDPVDCRVTNDNSRQVGRFNLLLANKNPHFKFQIEPSFLRELLTKMFSFNPNGFLYDFVAVSAFGTEVG